MAAEKDIKRDLLKGLKVAALSLGCAKNLVDTEEVLGFLYNRGALTVAQISDADLILVNTCGFIEEAQKEALNTLRQMSSIKKKKAQFLVATGCLVEVFGKKLKFVLPAVDGFMGTHGYRHLDRFLKAVFRGLKPFYCPKPGLNYRGLETRLLSGAKYSVNVRIAEGCDNRCTYCLIPAIRGPQRSRAAEDILEEIKGHLATGTKEIVLIAQDTTAYGSDNSEGSFVELVEKILELEGDFWLRIMYTNPPTIKERLFTLMKSDKRLCRYLDLPLQHVDDKILKKMGRRYTKDELLQLIKKARQLVPDLALRTTLMVGFPGEGRREFENLYSFIKEHPFEHLGSFTYSDQKRAASYNMPGKVPFRVAKKRQDRLMTLQKEISYKNNQNMIGHKVRLLIEGPLLGSPYLFSARTQYQAPEVDGQVYLRSKKKLEPGDFVWAKIVAAGPYDFLAIS